MPARRRDCAAHRAKRRSSVPFEVIEQRVANVAETLEQVAQQRRAEFNGAELRLTEHPVTRAIGFRQQPDESQPVRGDEQFLRATVTKQLEVWLEQRERKWRSGIFTPYHRVLRKMDR